MTAHDKCRKIVARIAEVTGEDWTFGYIGNLDHRWGDDRSWSAFRPHPHRAGTSADRIGGVATDDLDKLVPVLQGALSMAVMLRG